MTSKLRELIAWELQDNWSFPILEIIAAITIVQVISFTTLSRTRIVDVIIKPFFETMLFVIAISVAIVFGKSFGDSIEKRKLVVLLSYPVSRTRVFTAKYLANLLTLFSIFGTALLAQGISLFMFEGLFPPVIWAFTFLYLFLVVFFTSSFMTFIALAVKHFGLSILLFLIYVFGMEYWLDPTAGRVGIYNLMAHLSLDLGPFASVSYLETWYTNWLNIGIISHGVFTQTHFLAALTYLLGGGLILLLAAILLINKIDLD